MEVRDYVKTMDAEAVAHYVTDKKRLLRKLDKEAAKEHQRQRSSKNSKAYHDRRKAAEKQTAMDESSDSSSSSFTSTPPVTKSSAAKKRKSAQVAQDVKQKRDKRSGAASSPKKTMDDEGAHAKDPLTSPRTKTAAMNADKKDSDRLPKAEKAPKDKLKRRVMGVAAADDVEEADAKESRADELTDKMVQKAECELEVAEMRKYQTACELREKLEAQGKPVPNRTLRIIEDYER